MENILYYFNMVSEGHFFFYAFIASLVILFVFLNKRRVSFVVPCVIISLVILNPFFYYIWDKLNLYAYWRILWIVPIIPVCAAAPVAIIEKIKEKHLPVKGGIICAFIIAFSSIGTFAYNSEWGEFTFPADNTSKYSKEVISTADYLLSIDDNPRIVADLEISLFIRQYSGKIDCLFGRDIFGFVLPASKTAQSVYNELNNPDGDMDYIATTMANEGYEYLITKDIDSARREQLKDSGFELINHISEFGIYEAHGIPTVKKERNDLGQVISISLLDEEGNIVNGDEGYSTEYVEYDKNGNISKVFYTDFEGNGVNTGRGAGWEREYDRSHNIIMEKSINELGDPFINGCGFAELRREYYGCDYIEKYYDLVGNHVITSYGYAGVKRFFDENNRITKEEYYDENDKPLSLFNEYYGILQEYDENGVLRIRRYLDVNRNPVLRKEGYLEVCWIDNESTGNRNVIFLDENGEELSYEGINLVKDIKVDQFGWSEWMNPNYNTINSGYNIGSFNLGKAQEGDIYTCQMEIEFYDVSCTEGESFLFTTQGSQDGRWEGTSIWGNSVLRLDAPPKDGVYVYTSSSIVTEFMTHISTFNIGFRCDNWSSGSFRVKNIKIEKGDTATPWTPGI